MQFLWPAQERTYIIGPHGGKGGTVKIDNFTGWALSWARH
jgi:hypothetical protein